MNGTTITDRRRIELAYDILDVLAERPMSEGEIDDRLEEIGGRRPPYEADEIYEELYQLRARGMVLLNRYSDLYLLPGPCPTCGSDYLVGKEGETGQWPRA